MGNIKAFRVLSGGRLQAITVEPMAPDSLKLCLDIVAAVESRAECSEWLAGQGLSARLVALVGVES